MPVPATAPRSDHPRADLTAAAAEPVPRSAGADAARRYPPGQTAMRIVRPEPELPCRVRLADGRVFTRRAARRPPPLAAARAAARRHRRARRAHARHPPRRRPAGGRPAPAPRALPARRRQRRPALAARAARARRADRRRHLRAPRPGERPGEEVFVGVAPRMRRAGDQATPSPPRAGCGSTSTGPTGSTRCGRSWPSGRASC